MSTLKVDNIQPSTGSTVSFTQILESAISTDTIAFRLYREDGLNSGTVNHITFLGYNVTSPLILGDVTKSTIAMIFESDFNDGSTRYAEWHLNIAAPFQSYQRPFAVYHRLTGIDANTSDVHLFGKNIFAFHGDNTGSGVAAFLIQSSHTTGTQLGLLSNDTGGKNWGLFSTGSTAGLGAGNLLLFNSTNTRYGLILSALGNVVAGDLVALTTTATDGFMYVPTCAGTPTGTPTAYTGKVPIVVDTTNNRWYFYSTGAWRNAGP